MILSTMVACSRYSLMMMCSRLGVDQCNFRFMSIDCMHADRVEKNGGRLNCELALKLCSIRSTYDTLEGMSGGRKF